MSVYEKAFEEALKNKLEDIFYDYLNRMDKEGAWGVLFRIYSRIDDEIRVVKVYKDPVNEINLKIYSKDVQKLKKYQDKNIVMAYDTGLIDYKEQKFFFIILDYIKGKSLDDIDVNIFWEIPFNKRIILFMQALETIEVFRTKYEVHNDLHLGNLMLLDDRIIIIDFGTSKFDYSAEESDFDLYSIKNQLKEFFLTQEEIIKIFKNIDLKTVNFKEFKKLVMNETKNEKEQKSQTQDLDRAGLEKYSFLIRLIYLLQKHKEIYHYEREELETIEEIGPLIGKLDIIQFLKVDLIVYSKGYKFFGAPDYSYLDTGLKLKDSNYQITYVSDNLAHWYEIEQLDSKIKFNSILFGIRDYDRHLELKVLDNFIDHLKSRMEELHLFPLLEEIEEKTHIMKFFFRLHRFLEYLFNDDYLNPTAIKERTDERVISELNWIKQNDKELNDYFTVFRRKDEPSKYDKVLSLLNGKYLVQFRSHIPFKSTIKTNGKIIESSATKKVNSTLYEIFESIKNHIKDNYKIRL